MDHRHKFYQALVRKPVDSWLTIPDLGPHRGIQPVNVQQEIAAVCMTADGLDVAAYTALHTTIDYAGLHDLLELRNVQHSWNAAAFHNAKQKQGG
jgi:hypothetical protein